MPARWLIPTQQRRRSRRRAEPVDIQLGDAPVKGDPNAPMTIVEYSDYQCPFCERFYTQTMGPLVDEYITTGKAKLVFKDFRWRVCIPRLPKLPRLPVACARLLTVRMKFTLPCMTSSLAASRNGRAMPTQSTSLPATAANWATMLQRSRVVSRAANKRRL